MTITTLKLEGRLDTAAVGKVELGFTARAGALTGPGTKAIIDLQDLTYISSLGIRLLVTTLKQLRQRGIAYVTLRSGSPLVNETLETAGLTEMLNLVDGSDAARAALGTDS